PPVVVRHTQPGNGSRLVDELGYLFLHRQAPNKVRRPLLWRQGVVQIGRLRGVLSVQAGDNGQEDKNRNQNSRVKSLHLFSVNHVLKKITSWGNSLPPYL